MRGRVVRLCILFVLIPFALISMCLKSKAQKPEATFSPAIPKVGDEAAMADWATPVAGLNVRPTHISAKEYYSVPVENLRTYPVYFPGREPEGYWEMLQRIWPQPLIEPEKLKTEADWVEAGQRGFNEVDDIHLRTLDPRFIAEARNRELLEQARTRPLPDGTVVGMRWVPTKQGVALSLKLTVRVLANTVVAEKSLDHPILLICEVQ